METYLAFAKISTYCLMLPQICNRQPLEVWLNSFAGLRASEIAALKVGDVFDETGGVKDTIYLAPEQTRGSETGTVLVNKKLKGQLVIFYKQYPVHNLLTSL